MDSLQVLYKRLVSGYSANQSIFVKLYIGFAVLFIPIYSYAGDTSASQQLTAYSSQAGRAGNSKQGELFFSQTHGGKWSCASCHHAPPVTQGKHASTGKQIKPLAPAANALAFTEIAKIDKWFKRNCKDVLERECTAGEKADVMSYLIEVKP